MNKILQWLIFHVWLIFSFLAWPLYVARNFKHLAFPPFLAFIFMLFFTLDRITKELVQSIMLHRQSIPIIDNRLYFTYVRNSGAAFGIFQGMTPLFVAVAVISAVAIMIYSRSIKRNDMLSQTALGFLLAGAIGNLYDRVQAGYVIDFIDIRFMPVFNIADMAINVGVAILFWQLLFAQNGCEDKKGVQLHVSNTV